MLMKGNRPVGHDLQANSSVRVTSMTPGKALWYVGLVQREGLISMCPPLRLGTQAHLTSWQEGEAARPKGPEKTASRLRHCCHL